MHACDCSLHAASGLRRNTRRGEVQFVLVSPERRPHAQTEAPGGWPGGVMRAGARWDGPQTGSARADLSILGVLRGRPGAAAKRTHTARSGLPWRGVAAEGAARLDNSRRNAMAGASSRLFPTCRGRPLCGDPRLFTLLTRAKPVINLYLGCLAILLALLIALSTLSPFYARPSCPDLAVHHDMTSLACVVNPALCIFYGLPTQRCGLPVLLFGYRSERQILAYALPAGLPIPVRGQVLVMIGWRARPWPFPPPGAGVGLRGCHSGARL